ncbi:MAG TPA: lysophospholipid acyltransferase family protein [Caulobacteraceae bacterium]
MKAWLRRPGVQRALAAAAAAYLRFAYRTIRWRYAGVEAVEPLQGNGQGLIICFWHEAISISAQCWPQDRPGIQQMRALISRSADGALIAETIVRLGVPAIRGSRAVEVERTREKGGTEALRDIVRWVKSGGAVAITPDGPRGPARSMGPGPALAARLSGAPVFMVGMTCHPAIRLNSWDRALLPLPFTKGAIVVEGPFHANDQPPEALAVVWREALERAAARAEALAR